MPTIDGFALSRYRSLREALQYVAPISKVNILAGPNNSGKSNVLRYVQHVLGGLHGRGGRRDGISQFKGHDIPLGLDVRSEFALAISTERALALVADSAPQELHSEIPRLRTVLTSPAFRLTDDDLVWLRYQVDPSGSEDASVKLAEAQLVSALTDVHSDEVGAISRASATLTSTRGGGRTDDLRRVIEKSLDLLSLIPRVETIGAFRQVQPGGEDFSGYGGQGIVAGLARLEAPDAAHQNDRLRFDSVNRFVQVVLDDTTASLRVPHHRQTINVDLNGTLLPLEYLGTGIHQVIILAAAATLLDNHIVCIEEPEIHLHPLLQRKLLHYLATETTNVYIIATHSAHLLDVNIASIFRVSLQSGGTALQRAVAPKQIAEICADLGYRPSDLVQANAVIWVEGPSDRIYLRHWLAIEDPTLVEAIHYSIMFYGGRLLNHLSPDDPDVEDFISLRRLNRHISILIDAFGEGTTVCNKASGTPRV